MKFSFRTGVYLVLATTIALLVAIGSAYQLTVTERVENANAEAQRQRITAKLEEFVSTLEAADSATLSYVISRSERDLERLRLAGARGQVDILDLAEFVADNAAQRERVTALDAAKTTMLALRQQAVQLRQQQGATAALSFIASDAYIENSRKIGTLVEEMRREERYLAAERDERYAARTRQLAPFTAWSALIAIGLAAFAAAVISRQRDERRRTEALAREQEQRHRLVTSSVPAMIAYVDTHHRLQFHNHAVEDMLEMPAARLENHHLAEVLGTGNYKSILPEIERALQGKRVEFERKWQGKGRRPQYLAGSFIPDLDERGRVRGFFAMLIDVSERVRQQEEIARINERLDLALQGSRLAIWDVNPVTGTAYLSEGWAEILGGPRQETITDTAALLALVHPDDRERVLAMTVAAVKGTSPEYHVEHRVRTRSGGWKWILSHGRVVARDAGGRALRITGTNADITARKEIEHFKDEFISVVSHELRTPLSSIVGSLGLLDGIDGLSEETQTLIRVARGNSQRLVRLINDILDLEKLDSDAMKIPLEPVELEALLAAAIRANQDYAKQYGVSFVLAESPGPAWVDANADKLMQVMANLLSNAAKFSPRGARVDVHLARVHDAFRISVANPGPGIPEEFKPRIFERFAQADASNSRQRGGTGLGLAICKMIIDRLGGRIGFVSTPRAGTTFYFELGAGPQAAQLDAAERGAPRAA
jgi:PAS domain S-box-containing protein